MKKILFTLITVLCLTVATKAQSINSLTANGVPENLEVTILHDSLVLLTWSPVEGALGYGILLYGEPLGLTSYADTSAKVEVVPEVEFCFTVTSILQVDENNYPTEISDQSEAVCVTTGALSIEELECSLNVYPNPVNDRLYIETEVEIEEVSIFDIYGRLTCRDASNASINASNASTNASNASTNTFNVYVQDLDAGIYFVKIVTENGEVVKRFIKK